MERECDVMMLLTYPTAFPNALITEGAMALYHDARASPAQPRIDKGIGRKTSSEGLAAWKRRRRSELKDVAADVDITSTAIEAASLGFDVWSDEMTAELERQTRNRRQHFLKIMNAGGLADTDYDAADEVAGMEIRMHEEELRRGRIQTALRKGAPLKMNTDPVDFSSLKFYVCHDLTHHDDMRVNALSVQGALMRADSAAIASAAIMSMPARPPLFTRLTLVLTGGIACEPLFVTSRGSSGTALMYEAALSKGFRKSKRLCWISPAAQQLHVELYRTFLECLCHYEPCRWALVDSLDEYLALLAKGDPHRFISVVTAEEKATMGNGAVTFDELIMQCCTIDAAQSRIDVGG